MIGGTVIFIIVMSGAVLLGVVVVLASDSVFTRREKPRWGDDYEGGFGSGYDPNPRE